jgi:hypothetical protein
LFVPYSTFFAPVEDTPMKKRLVVLALLVVATLSVAIAPVAAQAQSLEIYITGLTEDTMNWFREVAFPAFNEVYPDVELEILTGGWGDFDATVAGWITTGDGPDIVYLGSEYAATYGDLLADLTPYLGDISRGRPRSAPSHVTVSRATAPTSPPRVPTSAPRSPLKTRWPSPSTTTPWPRAP